MQIFYGRQTAPNLISLEEDEAKHCIKVLRHKEGDQIHVIDGKGSMFEARIIEAKKDHIQANILHTWPNWGEHPYQISLCISPLRLKDRFEWIIEKSVELGVNEIHLMQCAYTTPYPKIKLERLAQMIITALKQCKRSRVPELFPLKSFKEVLTETQKAHGFIGYCEATNMIQTFTSEIMSNKHLNLFIGPEGDFSTAEIEEARNIDLHEISLGTNRLRSETAAIYGLSVFKMVKSY